MNSDPADDLARLVEEARKGSHEAFTEIVRQTHARVRGYLGRFLRDKDTLDDLAQEAFLKAFRNLSSYRGDAPVTLWLLAIARNQALMYLREERNRRRLDPRPLRAALAEWLAEGVGSEPVMDQQELAALDQCMEGLPGPSADLVAQYYFKRRSLGEIARAAGKKSSAVGMMLLRVRHILRQCIQNRLADTGAKA